MAKVKIKNLGLGLQNTGLRTSVTSVAIGTTLGYFANKSAQEINQRRAHQYTVGWAAINFSANVLGFGLYIFPPIPWSKATTTLFPVLLFKILFLDAALSTPLAFCTSFFVGIVANCIIPVKLFVTPPKI